MNQKLSTIFDPVTTGTRFVTPLHSEDMNLKTKNQNDLRNSAFRVFSEAREWASLVLF
jgi:hypothetical protein